MIPAIDDSVSRETAIEPQHAPPVLIIAPGDVVLLTLPFALSSLHADRISAQIGQAIGHGVRVVLLDLIAGTPRVVAVFRPYGEKGV